jgi:dTDP-4-amino-4,6-dideoxygalactose transaminase
VMIKHWISVSPPVTASIIVRRPRRELPFPLSRAQCRLFRRARHGLWHALREYGFEAGDEALVPDYHHGSEVETLVRAGLHPRFYSCNALLEPDDMQLNRLLNPRVRVLYLIHYLGFPQDAARWRMWADDNRLLLVEDAAQAWLSERNGTPAGALGDIAIFCLYKTLGLSTGGAVVSSRSVTASAGVPERGLGDLRTGLKRLVSQRWDVRQMIGPRSYVPFDPRRDAFDLGDPTSVPSRTAMFIIEREADVVIATRRRANYRALLNELLEFVPRAFAELSDGASPLEFPIQVRNKRAVLERLAVAGIEGADLWPRPHPLAQNDQSERARSLRSTLVGLPVHHGLRESDVSWVAEAARSAIRETDSRG